MRQLIFETHGRIWHLSPDTGVPRLLDNRLKLSNRTVCGKLAMLKLVWAAGRDCRIFQARGALIGGVVESAVESIYSV